jgi:ribonuclease III
MQNKIKDLQKIINYTFKNKSILIKSLTHKSFDNENNNEKLEFLGDRVLGLVISYKLLEKFPQEKEGIIDKKFANLVNKKTCLLIAKKLNLKNFLIIGESHKNLDRSEDKIISDCLEAIIGAIYFDGGLKASQKFILNFWSSYLDDSIITLVDSKTLLQEYSLKKFKELPNYIFHKKIGPQHKPIFKTEVQIRNSKKIFGTGTSKKNAQQNAAAKLLRTLSK